MQGDQEGAGALYVAEADGTIIRKDSNDFEEEQEPAPLEEHMYADEEENENLERVMGLYERPISLDEMQRLMGLVENSVSPDKS